MTNTEVLDIIKEYEDRKGAYIWDRNFSRLAACRRLLRYLRLKYNVVETHVLNVSGYFNKTFFDSQTEWKYLDTKYGNGLIYFRGTLTELEQYTNWLVENEGKTGIKLL
jgi:hypothetical protein